MDETSDVGRSARFEGRGILPGTLYSILGNREYCTSANYSAHLCHIDAVAIGSDMAPRSVLKLSHPFRVVCVGDSGRRRHRAALRGSPQDL